MLDGNLSDVERLEKVEVNKHGRIYLGRDMAGAEATVIVFDTSDTDAGEDTDE